MVERTRQESREAFILHGYPYRETSLLLEAFTRPFGRVSMVARGARSPRSPLRGVLLAFQPLALSWFGKGELRTLARAEWVGGQPLLHGEALLCGFYLNELLLRLVPREDPHDALFSRYWETLQQLASQGGSAAALRSFERALLKELGYAMTLERDSASGGAIDPAKSYTYDPERGPRGAPRAGRGRSRDHGPSAPGRAARALAGRARARRRPARSTRRGIQHRGQSVSRPARIRARSAAGAVHARPRRDRRLHLRPRLGPRQGGRAPRARREGAQVAGRAREPVHGSGPGGDDCGGRARRRPRRAVHGALCARVRRRGAGHRARTLRASRARRAALGAGRQRRSRSQSRQLAGVPALGAESAGSVHRARVDIRRAGAGSR